VADGPGGQEIRLVRTFRAPIEDVWTAVTESAHLERWIGRWEGDPADGRVRFFMTAEGEDVAPEEVEIVECAPPRRLAVVTAVGDRRWHLRVELRHSAGITTLVFAQATRDDDMSSVGPGWEYYLDRLAASLGGRKPSTVVWDDYFPAMSAYYATLTGPDA
jgi:uncharacterized protein YndB with AHSA1/START domain